MKENTIYRHGDVFLRESDAPANLKTLNGGIFGKTEDGGFILALGEVTGHKHVITAERPKTKVRIMQDEQGRHFLKIEGGDAKLTHEEHKTLTVHPGLYLISREREFDYFSEANRTVLD